MEANIVKIGNSKGIRIPKTLLTQTKLSGKVKMEIKDGGIFISASSTDGLDDALLSEDSLGKLWNDPREDEAWKDL